jgi:hypothetical protein
MKARKTTKGGVRKRPCPAAQLAAQLEPLCAGHLRADNAACRGDKSGQAILDAYDYERDAIAVRASYVTAQSSSGAAFQIALAASDAEVLISCTLADQNEADRIRERMHRLLVSVVRYLQGNGAVLPPTVAEYHMREAAGR